MKTYYFLMLLWCAGLHANQIAWVELKASFTYTDPELSYSTEDTIGMGTVFLVASIDKNNHVTYADLRTTNMPLVLDRLVLTEDERNSIDFEKDVVDEWYAKNIRFSPRMLKWILAVNKFFTGRIYVDKQLNASLRKNFDLALKKPASFTFKPKDGARIYAAPVQVFERSASNGDEIRITFGFVQLLLEIP